MAAALKGFKKLTPEELAKQDNSSFKNLVLPSDIQSQQQQDLTAQQQDTAHTAAFNARKAAILAGNNPELVSQGTAQNIISQDTGKVTLVKNKYGKFETPSKDTTQQQDYSNIETPTNVGFNAQVRQAAANAAAQQVGQLTPEQQALNPIRNEPAIDKMFQVAGITGGAYKGGQSGGAYGGVIGSLVGGEPGAVVGAAVGGGAGAIIGGIGGYYTAVSGDARNNVQKSVALFVGARKNMAFLTNEANHNPNASPWDLEQKWNTELANLHAADRNLKQLTQEDLNRYLSGGEVDYTTLKAFLRKEDQLNLDFQFALTKPNPNARTLNFEDTTQNG